MGDGCGAMLLFFALGKSLTGIVAGGNVLAVPTAAREIEP
jgi:hypothetical protein